jgi:hypothetical protein
LQDVPQELVTRILSLAFADDGVSAEHLFRLGGLCSTLRRASGSVDGAAASMAATWTRAIIALVDPAGALVATCSAAAGGLLAAPACYLAHARALGGWYHLAHALANCECVVCGDVTRFLAWCHADAGAAAGAVSSDGGVPFGLCRCCAACTPPAAGAEDADDGASDGSESDGFLRCALVNQQFWVAEPTVVLDAADWEHPAERLAACLREASDGDTIGLRGEFRSLRSFGFRTSAVRLLGMPSAAPWRCVHASGPNDTPGQRMEQLRSFERDSAAALGFPGAMIHVEGNCVEAYEFAWFDNVYISSGPRNMGSQLPGEHEHFEEGVRAEGGYFSGLGVFPETLQPPGAPSLVLRRCWLTGYYGTSLVLSRGSCAALLCCVITNSRCDDIYVPPLASLRMRGCRVMCSMFHDTRPVDAADALSEPLRALVAANDFFCFAPPAPLAAGAAAAVARAMPYKPVYDVTRVRLLS